MKESITSLLFEVLKKLLCPKEKNENPEMIVYIDRTKKCMIVENVGNRPALDTQLELKINRSFSINKKLPEPFPPMKNHVGFSEYTKDLRKQILKKDKYEFICRYKNRLHKKMKNVKSPPISREELEKLFCLK